MGVLKGQVGIRCNLSRRIAAGVAKGFDSPKDGDFMRGSAYFSDDHGEVRAEEIAESLRPQKALHKNSSADLPMKVSGKWAAYPMGRVACYAHDNRLGTKFVASVVSSALGEVDSLPRWISAAGEVSYKTMFLSEIAAFFR